MVEISKGSLIGKILLHVGCHIYLLGYNPSQINTKYLKKSSKGFLNLSTFGFDTSVKLVDNSDWFSSANHDDLNVLDSTEFSFKEGV